MFATSLTSTDLLFLLQGAWTTILLTLGAMLLGSLGGLLCGLLRATWPRASLPLAWLLDLFRSVPLLIQFVLFNALKSIAGMDMSAFTVGCIVLGVYAAAFCTEVVRSGVLAVPRSHSHTSRG